MKIKSKIGDGLFIGLVVFTVLTLAMYVLWVVTTVWWPAITLTAILLIVIVPIYFFTYYEITRNELRIYCGIFGKSIPYRNIISMTDAESLAPSFCLSHQRILIRYIEDEQIKSTYVSPANREQFRDIVNAEISKSAEIYKNAPKSAQDKAVAKAREQQVSNPEITTAEQRANKHADTLHEEQQRKVLNRELANLDNVINSNVEKTNNIQNVKTVRVVTPEQRKKAEQKLLAKIRKFKQKRDLQQEKEDHARAKEQAQIAQVIERQKIRAEQEAKKKQQEQEKQEKQKQLEKEAKKVEEKAKQPETENERKQRLAHEKEELKKAIESAKKDQYVPTKKATKTPADTIVLDTGATKQENDKTTKQKDLEKTIELNLTEDEQKSTNATKKEVKKEKVAQAKQSTPVVKNNKKSTKN